MIYWQLLGVYLKIGIFGFGGGYAMLSLIQYEVVDKYHWLTLQEFTDVVAISQMTPGPIGINSATYIGYTATGSVWGSVIATFAVCLPSFLLVLLISFFYAKFKNNKYVAAAFTGLRPMTVGLIGAAALLLMNKENFIDYKSILIFAGAFLLTWKYKIHPILMICLAGVAGLVIYWEKAKARGERVEAKSERGRRNRKRREIKKTEKAVYYGKSTFDTLYGNRIPSAYFDWNTVFICTGNPVGRYRSRPDQSNSSG